MKEDEYYYEKLDKDSDVPIGTTLYKRRNEYADSYYPTHITLTNCYRDALMGNSAVAEEVGFSVVRYLVHLSGKYIRKQRSVEKFQAVLKGSSDASTLRLGPMCERYLDAVTSAAQEELLAVYKRDHKGKWSLFEDYTNYKEKLTK